MRTQPDRPEPAFLKALRIPPVTSTGTKDQPLYAKLGTLSWLHFLNDGAANYLPGILPALLIALHVDVRFAGIIMSALLVGQSLQVFSGWFADHVGGRWMMLLGLVGSSVGAALIGWANQIVWLIPALVAIGVSNAFFHPQALACARQACGSRPGFGMSLFLIGGEIGRGLWPLIGSVVVVYLGLGWLWLLGLPALLTLALAGRSLPRQRRRHSDANRIAWREHIGPMSALVVFSLLRALLIFGAVTYVPLLWHARGYSLDAGAGAIAMMLVVGIVGNIGGGHLADRIGRRAVLIASSLACSVLLALFVVCHGDWQWFLLGLLGVAMFAALPLGIVIGQDLFPENRSLGSGMALGLSNGLAALALIGLGPIASRWGIEAVFPALAAMAVAAALIGSIMPTSAGSS